MMSIADVLASSCWDVANGRLPGVRTDPKHESPIEEVCARHIKEHLAPEAKCVAQAVCKAGVGVTRRVDFVLVRGESRVGIECDGAEYHRDAYQRDRDRDCSILTNSSLRGIVRVRGSDLNHQMDGVLHYLRTFAPEMFASDRERSSGTDWFAANVGRRGVLPVCRFKVSARDLDGVPAEWLERGEIQGIARIRPGLLILEAKPPNFGFHAQERSKERPMTDMPDWY